MKTGWRMGNWSGGLGLLLLLTSCPGTTTQPPSTTTDDALFLCYVVNPRRQALRLYWQDEHGQPLRSLGRLRAWLARRNQRLVFACNGGMYGPGNVPVGLLVEDGRVRTPLDTAGGVGNFYLRPNGVFFLTADGQAWVVPTAAYRAAAAVRYATQSGPLLVLDGQLHPAFRANSPNRHLRNGVGILPDGRVLLVQSKQPVTFHELARYFQRRGCRQALYLDGFVSRTYLPAQHWQQLDGDFGVMLGVTERF